MQAAGTHEAFMHAAPQHMLSEPGSSSQLSVDALYQLQLPQATLQQPVMPNTSQANSAMLHMPAHPEAGQQHLPPPDQGLIDQHVNQLESADTGEAALPLPPNTDYKHKPRRKATERPSVSHRCVQSALMLELVASCCRPS